MMLITEAGFILLFIISVIVLGIIIGLIRDYLGYDENTKSSNHYYDPGDNVDFF
ncbi:protein of unknown function [Tenacibaculum sp. 190130A14a]